MQEQNKQQIPVPSPPEKEISPSPPPVASPPPPVVPKPFPWFWVIVLIVIIVFGIGGYFVYRGLVSNFSRGEFDMLKEGATEKTGRAGTCEPLKEYLSCSNVFSSSELVDSISPQKFTSQELRNIDYYAYLENEDDYLDSEYVSACEASFDKQSVGRGLFALQLHFFPSSSSAATALDLNLEKGADVSDLVGFKTAKRTEGSSIWLYFIVKDRVLVQINTEDKDKITLNDLIDIAKRIDENIDEICPTEKISEAEIGEEAEECLEQEIPYYKYKCLEDLAFDNIKKETCDKIPVENTERPMYEVYMVVSQGTCITRIAEKIEDESLCENIKNNEDKDYCYSHILWTKAKKEINFDHCDKIPTEEFRAQCIGDVAALKENVKLCNNFKPKYGEYNQQEFLTDCIGHFYQFQAFKYEDISFCLQIEDINYWKSICISNLAENQNNLNLCYYIKNTQDLCHCFNDVLAETSLEKCNQLEDPKQNQTCLDCLK